MSLHRLALLAVLGPGLVGCNNRLFLHPPKAPGSAPSGARTVMIEGRRGRGIETFVRAYDTDGGPARAWILTFSGNAGSASAQLPHTRDALAPLMRALADAHQGRKGTIIVAANFPGFGDSGGPATLRALGKAALDTYDEVVRMADGAPVVVHGLSMGTTAALHIAASDPAVPPAALVLERGPDIPRLVLGRFGWWNLWLVAGPVAMTLPPSACSVARARRIESVPALFVLGTRDRLARPRNGHSVYRAYDGPKRVQWLDVTHNGSLPEGALAPGLAWLASAAGLASPMPSTAPASPAAAEPTPPPQPASPPPDAVRCAQQAAETTCRPQFAACEADAECATLEQCLHDCNDRGYTDECVDACAQAHPDALDMLDAASHCLHEACGHG